MEKEELEIEYVKRYLDRRLSEEENIQFKERLAVDEDFRNLYEELKIVLLGIKSYSRKKSLDKLRNVESALKEKGKKRIYMGISRNLRYWAAAAVFILLALTAVWIIQLGTPDSEALYTQYYQPYPNVFEPTLRGESDTLSLYEQAFAAYDQNNYTDAVQHFEELLQKDELDGGIEKDILLFYIGNSYLALDKPTEAVENLTTVSKNSLLGEQAQWYLALAYLKSEQLEEAEKMLEELTNTSGVYREKAETLLKEIQY